MVDISFLAPAHTQKNGCTAIKKPSLGWKFLIEKYLFLEKAFFKLLFHPLGGNLSNFHGSDTAEMAEIKDSDVVPRRSEQHLARRKKANANIISIIA